MRHSWKAQAIPNSGRNTSTDPEASVIETPASVSLNGPILETPLPASIKVNPLNQEADEQILYPRESRSEVKIWVDDPGQSRDPITAIYLFRMPFSVVPLDSEHDEAADQASNVSPQPLYGDSAPPTPSLAFVDKDESQGAIRLSYQNHGGVPSTSTWEKVKGTFYGSRERRSSSSDDSSNSNETRYSSASHRSATSVCSAASVRSVASHHSAPSSFIERESVDDASHVSSPMQKSKKQRNQRRPSE
jgi:hypothetical protein